MMIKNSKKWLWIAVALIGVGIILFLVALIGLKGDLSMGGYDTKRYEITEGFENVSISTETGDIQLAVSNDGSVWVECYEPKNLHYTATVENDTLSVGFIDERKWYEFSGFNFTAPKITIYMPQGEYGAFSIRSTTGDTTIAKEFLFHSMDITATTGDISNYASVTETVKIKTTTGNIRVEEITAKALDLSVSTGNIHVTNLTCKNLTSNGGTGDISLKNVLATEKIRVESGTGDIRFEACDAGEIYAKTSTGDVRGTLKSTKNFIATANTGRVNVPQSGAGGKCELYTNTGNISIEVQN